MTFTESFVIIISHSRILDKWRRVYYNNISIKTELTNMKKRLLCLFFALCLALSAALSEEFALERMTKYIKNPAGEAVIDDVDMTFYADPGKNRVFYEIFVGSFSDSDGDGTGDLRGIINRLDYLNDGNPMSGTSLGVQGIWLTPVYASPSYHKYDVTDYYSIDPSFGTMEDLTGLISACHERGMLLILDLPINHTGSQNRMFQNFKNAHLLHNPGNIYYDMFTWVRDGELPAGRHFTFIPGTKDLYESNFSDDMPELNFDNERAYAYALDIAKFYLELGVDGFRFDAAKYIYYGDHDRSAAFWERFTADLRAVKPDIYLVAEVWDGDGITQRYYDCLDCFDFTVSQAEGLIAQTAKAGDVNRYTAYVQDYLNTIHSIREDALFVPFIANHDTDRAAGYLSMSNGQAKAAANLLLLSPGSPFLYYGEEIGLRGSRGGANTDANRRMAMQWGDGDTVTDPVGTTYTSRSPYAVSDLIGNGDSLYSHYKRLIMLRNANPEIALGTYKALALTGTKAGGFVCEYEGRKVAVIHNTAGRSVKLTLADIPELKNMELTAFIGVEDAKIEGGMLIIGAQTSAILRGES